MSGFVLSFGEPIWTPSQDTFAQAQADAFEILYHVWTIGDCITVSDSFHKCTLHSLDRLCWAYSYLQKCVGLCSSSECHFLYLKRKAWNLACFYICSCYLQSLEQEVPTLFDCEVYSVNIMLFSPMVTYRKGKCISHYEVYKIGGNECPAEIVSYFLKYWKCWNMISWNQ